MLDETDTEDGTRKRKTLGDRQPGRARMTAPKPNAPRERKVEQRVGRDVIADVRNAIENVRRTSTGRVVKPSVRFLELPDK